VLVTTKGKSELTPNGRAICAAVECTGVNNKAYFCHFRGWTERERICKVFVAWERSRKMQGIGTPSLGAICIRFALMNS
jgi:hypothetical protein